MFMVITGDIRPLSEMMSPHYFDYSLRMLGNSSLLFGPNYNYRLLQILYLVNKFI